MKTAIISGASGGIGSEIASRLAQSGYNLILIYNNNSQSIKDLCTSLPKNIDVKTYQRNLTNSKQIEEMFKDIRLHCKQIDVLVNCAGVSLSKQVQHITNEDYSLVMDSNFKSTVMLTKHTSEFMIEQKSGCIVNISSMWGVVGASVESLYSASKGAMNSFTLSLAKELGPSGIRVNAVCPGLINTKMNSAYTKHELDEIVSATPLGRIGEPKDVANLVNFLCSNEASFITGQIITIDGGLTL